jgi:hypothetical protein
MLLDGITLAVYDEQLHAEMLNEFFTKTSIENNKDMNVLGLNKRPNSMLCLVIQNDMIVNMSYAHDFSEYYPNSFRIFTRTATLEGHRGQGFYKGKNMLNAAGLASWTAWMQIEHAIMHGAKDILFTSNSEGGMASSRRMGRFLEKIEPIDPRFSYFDEREIYGCQQKVWRINYRDLHSMTNPL